VTWTPPKSPFHPHFIILVARRPEVSKVRSLTELCGFRVSMVSYLAPKGPLQCKRCHRFGHTQHNCGYAPRCVTCGDFHLSGGCFEASVLWLRRKPHGELPGLYEMERSEGGSCKQAPEHGRKSAATLPLRKLSGPRPLSSRWT
jgi:hypothetical protein